MSDLNSPPHTMTAALPPTKSWALRFVLYHSSEAMPPATGDDRDGTLVIEQHKKLNCTPKQKEYCEYAIEEVSPEIGVAGRQFWVLHLDDAKPDVYKTTLGSVDRCTCDANRLGLVRCKHMDGLRAVIAADCLPVRPLRPEGGA